MVTRKFLCTVAGLVILALPATAWAQGRVPPGDVPPVGPGHSGPWVLLDTLNPAVGVAGDCKEPYSSGNGHNGTPKWVLHTYDLSAYANQEVEILFRFRTGDELYNEFEGWYLDDISIGKLSEGFEAGSPGWGSNFDNVPTWHNTDYQSHSGSFSINYGRADTHTFQGTLSPPDNCVDKENEGELWSPVMCLGPDAELSFWTLWEIESVDADAFDLMEVFVRGKAACAPKIPTVSQWGIAIMGLLLLVGAKVYFGRRRAAQA